MVTIDRVPQSLNRKLKVMPSADLFLGLQLGFWPEGIQTVSRFREGIVACLCMVMLKPSLLQRNCFDDASVENMFELFDKQKAKIYCDIYVHYLSFLSQIRGKDSALF